MDELFAFTDEFIVYTPPAVPEEVQVMICKEGEEFVVRNIQGKEIGRDEDLELLTEALDVAAKKSHTTWKATMDIGEGVNG